MQGNLDEIDIRSILQLIELGQRTGLLFVEAYSSHSRHKVSIRNAECQLPSWFVFFLNGQIIYATNDDSSLSRLSHYLRHYRVNVQLDERQAAALGLFNTLEYGYLWMLLEKNIIKPVQARSIIYNFVYETLFDILSLHQGRFIFELGSALTPQLTSVAIAPLVITMTKQVQEWKQLYPLIQSPEQFPLLVDIDQLRTSLSVATVSKLQYWADGHTSLRQLARYLNRDILTVAKAIYPYVKQGWLKCIFKYTEDTSIKTQNLAKKLEKNHKAYIACIDDVTICEIVEAILKPHGYEVIALPNPLEALNQIFQLEPVFILCNIAMSELNGYEICAMLRHSTAFRFVPIILLSDRLNFVEQTRARIVGATDSLTKPFTDTELLMLVERYVTTVESRATKKIQHLLSGQKME
ncbi:two-component system response regulator [Nostocales cyanobacterium HT-58-2]|nr:two-component system response regulator [Nostocales cyanobacterium HT-58-2]